MEFFSKAAIAALFFLMLPATATAQQTEESIIPYQNGDRIEGHQIRDALNYYDIVFYSGDNIQRASKPAYYISMHNRLSAVALVGWDVPDCTIVFSIYNIDDPSADATFDQSQVDSGAALMFAEWLLGGDSAPIEARRGACYLEHNVEQDRASPVDTGN